MCLTFAEAASLLAAQRVEAFWQIVDKGGACTLQGLHHLLFGGARFPQLKILAYGAAHECVALRDIDEITTHARVEFVGVLVVVYLHFAVDGAYQRQNQSHQSRLASTRLAKNGCATAWTEVEVHVLDDVALFHRVGIRHVGHSDAARSVHPNGVALLFERRLFKFHQTFGGGEHRNEGRHEFREITGRTLYFPHQLEEGGHSAECQCTVGHSHGCPQEGEEITEGEAEVEDEVREHAEACASNDVVAQFTLRVLQSVHHHRVAFQRLDEHAVLNGLLQYALHLRVGVAHLTRQTTHLADVDFADRDEQRQRSHDDDSQPFVHREEVEEGSEEQSNDRERAGDGLGKEAHHVVDVELQSVEHVARVMSLLAPPLRAKQSVEHGLLHSVLRLDAQDVAHPDARDA